MLQYMNAYGVNLYYTLLVKIRRYCIIISCHPYYLIKVFGTLVFT